MPGARGQGRTGEKSKPSSSKALYVHMTSPKTYQKKRRRKPGMEVLRIKRKREKRDREDGKGMKDEGRLEPCNGLPGRGPLAATLRGRRGRQATRSWVGPLLLGAFCWCPRFKRLWGFKEGFRMPVALWLVGISGFGSEISRLWRAC